MRFECELLLSQLGARHGSTIRVSDVPIREGRFKPAWPPRNVPKPAKLNGRGIASNVDTGTQINHRKWF